jgi:hypothetical protein
MATLSIFSGITGLAVSDGFPLQAPVLDRLGAVGISPANDIPDAI